MKNKNSAAVLAFVLGGVGVHKFYLGETGWGIVYAVFFWTYIPTIAGFIEAILLLGMSPAEFDKKYNSLALYGQESRYLTNNPAPQVIVNIGDNQSVYTSQANTAKPPVLTDKLVNSTNPPKSLPTNDALSAEHIDRQILKLCKAKGEMTLLDCFLELEDIPKRILKARLENLVREEFLEISNRETDGKIVYRLDN